jgi:pyruvate ferredoxin oxidoreductase beta subunit
MFPVFEAEHGAVTGSRKIRRQVPVEDYLKPQRRFAHLFASEAGRQQLARLQACADRNIADYHLLDEQGDN